MWKRRAFYTIFSALLCFCLFAPSHGICSEIQTYTISANELEKLQNHLIALGQNNSELERLLTESGVDLTTASTALSESKKEIEKLQTQLKTLREETKQLSASLETANRELQNARISFKQYEAERDKTESRLRTQRNIWEILCAVAVGFAVAK